MTTSSFHDTATLPRYSTEVCATCGDVAVGALLDDHGFVIEAACARHRGALALAFVDGAFVIDVAP